MKTITCFRCLLFGTVCVSAVCWPQLVVAEEAASSKAFEASEPFGQASVAPALEDYRGGADYFLNDIKSDGVVRDNQAINLTTGSNWVTEGSFTGAAGFPTVVQNSGNNVLIQNATIINLQVQ